MMVPGGSVGTAGAVAVGPAGVPGVGLLGGEVGFSGTGVCEGAGIVVDGEGSLGEGVGVSSGPSTCAARGQDKNTKSPANDRAPAGLNRGTFTPSS